MEWERLVSAEINQSVNQSVSSEINQSVNQSFISVTSSDSMKVLIHRLIKEIFQPERRVC